MTTVNRRTVCAALLAAGILAACEKSSVAGISMGKYKGLDVSGGKYDTTTLQGLDAAGKTRTLAEFEGKVVALFFGFTSCPDVCPTTLQEMRQVKRLLGDKADQLQVVFVSIDPERDKPELLKQYMEAFDPSFLGLQPDPEVLRTRIAPAFKVYYNKVPSSDGKAYTMDHSAGVYLLDTKGKMRLHENYGAKPEDVAHDIQLLLQEKA